MHPLELADLRFASSPCTWRVVAGADLFLVRAGREQRRRVFNERSVSRDYDRSVGKYDNATAAGTVQLCEGKRVLLLLTDGAEPDPGVLALQERSNRRLLTFGRSHVSNAVFPQMRHVAKRRASGVHAGPVALWTVIAFARIASLPGWWDANHLQRTVADAALPRWTSRDWRGARSDEHAGLANQRRRWASGAGLVVEAGAHPF
jgi:hypothetical protein